MRIQCDDYPNCDCPIFESCLPTPQIEAIEAVIEAAKAWCDEAQDGASETTLASYEAKWALVEAIEALQGVEGG